MVTILVGMIASGKDTFIKMLAERGHLIINDDDIVKAVHGGNYLLYDQALKPVYKDVEVAILMDALTLKRPVVINRPNFRISTRRRYIGLAEAHDVPVVGIVFPKETPEVHAKRRFDHDNRGISYEKWVEIAKVHASQWEEPKMEEGFSNLMPAHVAKQMVLAGQY